MFVRQAFDKLSSYFSCFTVLWNNVHTILKVLLLLKWNVHKSPVDLMKDRLSQDGRGGVQDLELATSLAPLCRLLVWVPHLKQWGDGSLSSVSQHLSLTFPQGSREPRTASRFLPAQEYLFQKSPTCRKNNEKERQKENPSSCNKPLRLKVEVTNWYYQWTPTLLRKTW